MKPLYLAFKFIRNYKTKGVYLTNSLPTWQFPLLGLYLNNGVLFVTSKCFTFSLIFFCFHSNAFRGRVTSLRSLQLTAESQLLSIDCTQERVGNRVRVRCSIYWVYTVHRDIRRRAARAVSSMGPLQRPWRNYITVKFYAATEQGTFLTAQLVTPFFYCAILFQNHNVGIIKLSTYVMIMNLKCLKRELNRYNI